MIYQFGEATVSQLHQPVEVLMRRFGLTGDRHEPFRTGVRKILCEYDGAEIATLAAPADLARLSRAPGAAAP